MTVVTPLAPGEHPAGFPHRSGHAAVPAARPAPPGGTEAASGPDAPEATAGAASSGAESPRAEAIRRILAERPADACRGNSRAARRARRVAGLGAGRAC